MSVSLTETVLLPGGAVSLKWMKSDGKPHRTVAESAAMLDAQMDACFDHMVAMGFAVTQGERDTQKAAAASAVAAQGG